MIYYVLYELLYNHFKEKDWFLIKALNVFQYVTFRTAYASVTALLLSLVFGGKLIEALRRWNIGQQIREEGPQGHMAKRGTPTMGGVLIAGAVPDSSGRLGGVVHVNQIFRERLFMERQHSISEGHCRSERYQLHWPIPLSGSDPGSAAGFFKRG